MTLTPTTDSPFAYVPVPHEHVPAVMTYVAGLISGQPSDDQVPGSLTPSPALVTPSAATEDWSDDELRAFLAGETRTAEIVGRLLARLSEAPGEESAISTSQVAAELDLTYSQVKVLPTQISRTLGKRFPGKTSPLTHKWGPEISPSHGEELFYYVTPERAEQLKRITERDA